jgi:hypothetical protein
MEHPWSAHAVATSGIALCLTCENIRTQWTNSRSLSQHKYTRHPLLHFHQCLHHLQPLKWNSKIHPCSLMTLWLMRASCQMLPMTACLQQLPLHHCQSVVATGSFSSSVKVHLPLPMETNTLSRLSFLPGTHPRGIRVIDPSNYVGIGGGKV